MANKNAGEVALQIGDTSYIIKVTSKVLGSVETLLGIDSIIGRQLGIRATAYLLYYLCKDQGMASIDEAYDALDKYLISAQNAIHEALDFFYQNQIGLIEEAESA